MLKGNFKMSICTTVHLNFNVKFNTYTHCSYVGITIQHTNISPRVIPLLTNRNTNISKDVLF